MKIEYQLKFYKDDGSLIVLENYQGLPYEAIFSLASHTSYNENLNAKVIRSLAMSMERKMLLVCDAYNNHKALD